METAKIFATGCNVRDHCAAIERVLSYGRLGETYNIGASCENRISKSWRICAILDEERPRDDGKPYAQQISFIKDRPGYDLRYGIDASKIRSELGWKPKEGFETGLRKTVNWYLANQEWSEMSLGAPTKRLDCVHTAGIQKTRKGIILAGGSGTRLYLSHHKRCRNSSCRSRQAANLLSALHADVGGDLRHS
jgi:hypothetical protein